MDITALGSSPVKPIELNTTMIIGANAKIGIVWLVIIHGITLKSVALSWTMAKANKIPKSVPSMKPANVADNVIQPW